MATAKTKVMGYLPNDTPPFGKMLLLGFQHVLTMFPATVLCALLMGFDCQHRFDRHRSGHHRRPDRLQVEHGQIHPPVLRLQLQLHCRSHGASRQPVVKFGVVASPHTLSVVQAGFLATGIINVIVGLIIRLAGGKESRRYDPAASHHRLGCLHHRYWPGLHRVEQCLPVPGVTAAAQCW